MSKRAEEAALKAYSIHSVFIQPARRGGYYVDGHLRDGFIKGYEQAKKDTIQRIREEIEKRINSIVDCPFIEAEFCAYERREGKIQSYKELLAFLDELEKE